MRLKPFYWAGRKGTPPMETPRFSSRNWSNTPGLPVSLLSRARHTCLFGFGLRLLSWHQVVVSPGFPPQRPSYQPGYDVEATSTTWHSVMDGLGHEVDLIYRSLSQFVYPLLIYLSIHLCLPSQT